MENKISKVFIMLINYDKNIELVWGNSLIIMCINLVVKYLNS